MNKKGQQFKIEEWIGGIFILIVALYLLASIPNMFCTQEKADLKSCIEEKSDIINHCNTVIGNLTNQTIECRNELKERPIKEVPIYINETVEIQTPVPIKEKILIGIEIIINIYLILFLTVKIFLFKLEDLMEYLKRTRFYQNVFTETIIDVTESIIDWLEDNKTWSKRVINVIALVYILVKTIAFIRGFII